MMPEEKAVNPSPYFFISDGACHSPRGAKRYAAKSAKSSTSMIGVSTLPTRSTSFDGVTASHHERAKKRMENTKSPVWLLTPRSGVTDISYDVEHVRGMAKNGPMVREIAATMKMPYHGATRPAMS